MNKSSCLIEPFLFKTRTCSIILSYHILSCLIISYLLLSYLILSYHILSYLIISCLVLSCIILSYILSYLILYCLIISYLVLLPQDLETFRNRVMLLNRELGQSDVYNRECTVEDADLMTHQFKMRLNALENEAQDLTELQSLLESSVVDFSILPV